MSGRRIEITKVEADADMQKLHLLFICYSEKYHAAEVLERLKGSTVLTVGEGKEFADLGVTMYFRIENSKLRFALDPDAAKRSGLEISPRLLKLAEIFKSKSKAK